jgi:hypothetical protein
MVNTATVVGRVVGTRDRDERTTLRSGTVSLFGTVTARSAYIIVEPTRVHSAGFGSTTPRDVRQFTW